MEYSRKCNQKEIDVGDGNISPKGSHMDTQVCTKGIDLFGYRGVDATTTRRTQRQHAQ